MKIANLVKNKYFCYLTYALMVINLLGYVSVGAMECVVVFALATFACKSCLTKNMCLCIVGGLFVSNILFGCSKVKEGLENNAESTGDDKCSAANKAALQEQISSLQEELDACDEEATGDDAADDDAADDAASDNAGGAPKEAFRNRNRGRRRAVRGALATLRRAVNSY